MNKVGRRTNDWRKAWRFLKAEFEARGRTLCEFWFIPHECCGILDPVHAHKRRNMEGFDIYRVAMGCRTVHNYVEGTVVHPTLGRFDHRAMYVAVTRAIAENGGLILPVRKVA